MNTPLYLGCAGWSLPGAHKAQFPGEGTHLERYARVLSAVEINSSFYQAHLPDTYARWRDAVPEHFRFSVKMPREITHVRSLRGCETLIETFLEGAGRLREKLGCLLVQLPPRLAYNSTVAERFFAALRRSTDVSIACEPRHRSWFSGGATAMLATHGVTRVEADPSPVPVTGIDPEGAVVYLRLHGSPEMYYSAYSTEFVEQLAARIEALRKEKKTVWCIFDNTANGASLPNALLLKERLALFP